MKENPGFLVLCESVGHSVRDIQQKLKKIDFLFETHYTLPLSIS